MNYSIFEEKQRFNQWWLWVLMIVVGIIPIGLQIYQIATIKNHLSNDSAMFSLILACFAALLVFVLFFWTTLRTKLDKDGVHVRLSPFHIKWRYYAWSSIKSCQVRNYNPLTEYGGWGIKGTKHDRAFNISGKQGIQFEFKDGNRLLIGTQKAKEVQNWLSMNLVLTV